MKKTIRIPVAIDTKGRWAATAWSGEDGCAIDDGVLSDEAYSSLDGLGDVDHSRIVWVTASVPVPEEWPDVEVGGECDGE